MERWFDKVAVVTGSSTGIGAACVKDLLNNGFQVCGLARRETKLQELGSSLSEEQQKKYFPMKCDVTNEDSIKKAFEWIEQNLGGIDVLINNAGVIKYTDLVKENNTVDLQSVVDTNLLGVAFCTREAFQSMRKRQFPGHIILINSIAGHTVPNFGPDLPSFNIYPATKFGITAMSEVYRQEFLKYGTKVKITSVSPGGTATDLFPEEYSKLTNNYPWLSPEDVSNAIMYVISTPPHVQIHELTIKPIGEPM
ncbi:DHRS11.2 family protein [Megaselia abdita]